MVGLGYVDKVVIIGISIGNCVGIDLGQYMQLCFGFCGVEDLGGGNKVEFVIEGGFMLDNGVFMQNGVIFGCCIMVGLLGNYGDVQLGCCKDYIDFIVNQYFIVLCMLFFIGKVYGNNLDCVIGECVNNMIYYIMLNFGGFQVNFIYVFGEMVGFNSIGQLLGLGVNYDNGLFGIGFVYWQLKKVVIVGLVIINISSDQGVVINVGCNIFILGNVGDICIKVWMLGSNYDIGLVILCGIYLLVKQLLVNVLLGIVVNFVCIVIVISGVVVFIVGGINNLCVDIYDVGVDYKLGNWVFKGSVIYFCYDFVGVFNKGKFIMLVLGVDYNLFKCSLLYVMVVNMWVFDMYSLGLISNGVLGVDKLQNVLVLGILYCF